MLDLTKLNDLYAKSEADEGMVEIPILPTGSYPCRITDIVTAGTSKEKGTPFVTFNVTVVEGPFANQNTRLQVYLANVSNPDVQEAVSKYYSLPADQRENSMTDEELKHVRNFGRAKGLMSALGVSPADVSRLTEPEKIAIEFYNYLTWIGKVALLGIGVETAEAQEKNAANRGQLIMNPMDRNTLRSYKKWDTEAQANWREKVLPKQIALVAKINAAKHGNGNGNQASVNI